MPPNSHMGLFVSKREFNSHQIQKSAPDSIGGDARGQDAGGRDRRTDRRTDGKTEGREAGFQHEPRIRC